MTIPLVAQARTVGSLVYVTPNLPLPGSSAAEAMAADPINTADVLAGGLEPVNEGLVRVSAELAASLFYNRCSPQDAEWATARLRLQAFKPLTETTPLKQFPDVPSRVVLGSDDRMLDVELMRGVAQRRIGVTPVVIDSDHSPFLSATEALADVLTSV